MITARDTDPLRTRSTRADSIRNRSLLLAAARDVFVEFGARASLDHIARRAGVSNATLYRHFANRETLIHDVMLSIVVRAADHAEMLVSEDSDPFAALCRFVHTAADQRVGILCGLVVTGTEEPAPDIRVQHDRMLSALTILMQRARLTGTLRSDVTIDDLLVALTQLSRPLPGINRRDTGSLGHRRLQVFLDGLAHRHGVELPRLVDRGEPVPAELQGSHRRATRRVLLAGRVRHQGAVRQLRVLPGHVRGWNANLWNNASGLLLWMSNPAWHSTVWQTYDYDLHVNGTYYGARSGCEAQHVQADPVKWNVLAVNHTAQDLRGAVVHADVLDLAGNRLADAQQAHVDIPASSTAPAFAVPKPTGDHPLHLVRLRLTDSAGKTLSQNTYWRYDDPKDVQSLNALSGGRPEVTGGRTSPHDGQVALTVTVRNKGRAVAPMVRLSLRDHRSGDRVLPALYSDNYLWLLPGEETQVTITCPLGDRRHDDLEVTARAYNAPIASNRR